MILDYIRQNPIFYPPLIADKFDLSLEETYAEIIRLWSSFENPHVVDNTIHVNYPKQNWYYEVADTVYKRGKYIPIESYEDYCLENQKPDQHVSVFAHDKRWVDNVEETGSVGCSNTLLYAPYLWIELDRKDYNKTPDLIKAMDDGYAIADKFKEYPNTAHTFYSGNNSAHVLIDMSLFGRPIVHQKNVKVFHRLALEIVGDIRFGNGIVDPTTLTNKELMEIVGSDDFDRQIACSSLENLDPHIYNVNSLIRQPWSYHESSGFQKKIVEVDHPTKLERSQHLPKLMKMWFDVYEPVRKSPSEVDFRHKSSYIVKMLQKKFEDIGEYAPNAEGWISGLYNPFYNDTNPSCSVNIYTGRIHDFGSSEFSMSFQEYLKKI